MSKPDNTGPRFAGMSVTTMVEFAGTPVIGHTYDAADPDEPVFTIPDGPQVGVAEQLSGCIDVRCAKPGRRGCESRMAFSREPGQPPMVIVEHKLDCPWLTACLAQPGAREQLASWRMERA